MSVAEAIESKVRDALPVAHLELENESHRHNVPANSETHFKLVLVSDAFQGQMPVRRHQAVYQGCRSTELLRPLVGDQAEGAATLM